MSYFQTCVDCYKELVLYLFSKTKWNKNLNNHSCPKMKQTTSEALVSHPTPLGMTNESGEDHLSGKSCVRE